jgi:hypothetical protein
MHHFFGAKNDIEVQQQEKKMDSVESHLQEAIEEYQMKLVQHYRNKLKGL